MKRLTLLVIALLVVALSVAVAPVQAGQKPRVHQAIAGLWLHQNSRDAMLGIGTVDAGPLPVRVTARMIAEGIRLYDDSGRSITFKARATDTGRNRYSVGFRMTGFKLIKRGAPVKVTHIDFMVFDGNDWAHPWEGHVCGSPSWSIEHCLDTWKPK